MFVCLSVCLSVSKITQKRVYGFGWNVACGTWTSWLTFEPDPDYSQDAATGLLYPISYKRCNAEFYCVGKIPRIRIGCPSLQRGVVSKWFYSPGAVSEHLCRRYMRSTEFPSSFTCSLQTESVSVRVQHFSQLSQSIFITLISPLFYLSH